MRTYRQDESLVPSYRNQVAFEDTVRKSLAEVYEDKFNEKQEGEPEVNIGLLLLADPLYSDDCPGGIGSKGSGD